MASEVSEKEIEEIEKLENEFRDALVHPKVGEFTWVAVTRLHLKKLEPYKRLVEAAKKIIDSGDGTGDLEEALKEIKDVK